MKTYLVTENPNKLKELQEVLPPSLSIETIKFDLPEIQSLDIDEVVEHKLKAAFEHTQAPVIVEDVSAELENLNGLPGTFVKFFEQKLGHGALYHLSEEGTRVKIICAMGYYDGVDVKIAHGVLHGTIVEPRGETGFGFDFVVVPEGQMQTMAEMGIQAKNKISHRCLAATQLAGFLALQN